MHCQASSWYTCMAPLCTRQRKPNPHNEAMAPTSNRYCAAWLNQGARRTRAWNHFPGYGIWHRCMKAKQSSGPPPARWRSLDFDKGATPPPPAAFSSSVSSSSSAACYGARLHAWTRTLLRAPDAVGHAWTRTLSRALDGARLGPNTIATENAK